MTCVAGVVKGSKVWIGADSAGVSDTSLQLRADEKVFRNGEFLMGFSGSFRARDLARYAFKPPKQLARQNDIEFLATSWVDLFRVTLIRGGMRHEDNVISSDAAFLLGYRGGLYYIDNDFQVGKMAAGFAAAGCGEDVALGALDVTASKPPALRIRHALEAAERWSAGVRGPFKVLSI